MHGTLCGRGPQRHSGPLLDIGPILLPGSRLHLLPAADLRMRHPLRAWARLLIHESRSTLVTDVSISSASRHRRLLGVKYGFPPRPALCVLREDEVIPEDRLNTSTGKATFDTWVVSHLSCEPSPHEPCHGASSRAVRASHARGTLPPRAPVCSLCGAGQAAASHQGGVRQRHRLAGHYWCQARDTG
jgi:hypothetical protein